MPCRFNPLWINTALKREVTAYDELYCFNPLWINTALKQDFDVVNVSEVSIPYGLTLLSNIRWLFLFWRVCFNPLWINTALKLRKVLVIPAISFNPLWINTALKLHLV